MKVQSTTFAANHAIKNSKTTPKDIKKVRRINLTVKIAQNPAAAQRDFFIFKNILLNYGKINSS